MSEPERDVRLRIAEEIERALGGGGTVAVATVIDGGDVDGVTPGAKLLVRASGGGLGSLGDAIDEAVRRAALDQLTAFPRQAVRTLRVAAGRDAVERRAPASSGDAQVLVELFDAPATLVIVGGGHIGLALAQVGEIAGFRVHVLDDRGEFASRERFPMAEHVYAGDLGEGLDAQPLDGSSYVVLVSRGHRQDEEALRHVVGRGAAYVGMIGSRRRVRTVLEHLLGEGFDRDALDAVHTPIGIDIGAETPEEIAISILAEVILVRRGGGGALMRERRGALRGA